MRPAEEPKYFGRDLEAMSFAENYHKWIIDEFKPYFGAKVAEVGAGTGNFSKLLIDSQIRRLVTFEPSKNMYPLIQKRLAEYNKVKTINQFFGNEYQNYEKSFDSIVYVNVLEHIKDDKKEVSYVYQALRKGGHILIFAPALSLLYTDFDRKLGHFRRYKKQSLIKLIQGAGFSVIKAKYFDFVGIIPWYVVFVLLKQSLTGGNVSMYDRLVVPVMRKIEGIIAPPIGKNLLLIGRKT